MSEFVHRDISVWLNRQMLFEFDLGGERHESKSAEEAKKAIDRHVARRTQRVQAILIDFIGEPRFVEITSLFADGSFRTREGKLHHSESVFYADGPEVAEIRSLVARRETLTEQVREEGKKLRRTLRKVTHDDVVLPGAPVEATS